MNSFSQDDFVLIKSHNKINIVHRDDFVITYHPPDCHLWRIIPSVPSYEMNAVGLIRQRKWGKSIKTNQFYHYIQIGGKSKNTKEWYLEVFPERNWRDLPEYKNNIFPTAMDYVHPDYKLCHCCEKMISKTDFSQQPRNTDGLFSKCKQCTTEFRNTELGRMHVLIQSCQNHTKERKRKRPDMADPEINEEILLEILRTKQKYLCGYSNIPFSLETGADWTVSLERLDPSIGYLRSNVVLIVFELNHVLQWSIEKLKKIIELENKPSSFTEKDINDALSSKRGYRKRRKITKLNGQKLIECPGCKTNLFESAFNHKSKICKECEKDPLKAKDEIRNFVQILLASARLRYPEGYELSLEWAREQLLKQLMVCFYSRIPFCFTTNANWRASLERKNQSEGYTKANTVFICLEFNTAMRQFSREKFLYLSKHLRQKYRCHE